MLYIKQIEEEVEALATPINKWLHIGQVVDYIVEKCNMNGIEIQYDKHSYCTECYTKPILVKREDHGGMAGSWRDYYKLQCPGCKKETTEFDDWTKDYMKSLIIAWNRVNS